MLSWCLAIRWYSWVTFRFRFLPVISENFACVPTRRCNVLSLGKKFLSGTTVYGRPSDGVMKLGYSPVDLLSLPLRRVVVALLAGNVIDADVTTTGQPTG